MARYYWNNYGASIDELEGKVVTKIEQEHDEVRFYTADGETYVMYHEQDCCESVTVEEIIGDLDDLIDSPILMAEEVTEDRSHDYYSQTWTFYKFATLKGYVTIRWLGESNGYYSESVQLVRLKKDDVDED